MINLDKLTYAGNLDNLRDISETGTARGFGRYQFIRGDIADKELVNSIVKDGIDAIVNFAAESHVDRSINDASAFIQTNIMGTQVLLDTAVQHKVKRFIQISTDEVYGSLGQTGQFAETTPLSPNSPYAASKASADLLVRSCFKTFHAPAIITRCSNNYGPYQFPEKLIPLFITNALADEPLPLYGDGLNVRDWIHVYDHCTAIDRVLQRGQPGEVYNIGGNCEKTNLEITKIILRELNKPDSLVRFVKDRPGHDRRYAIDCKKISNELGWSRQYDFEEGLRETIKWYVKNRSWWNKVKSGEYKEFYNKWYKDR
jgi:dTDP-glucose 4,6-dehydratase